MTVLLCCPRLSDLHDRISQALPFVVDIFVMRVGLIHCDKPGLLERQRWGIFHWGQEKHQEVAFLVDPQGWVAEAV